MEMGDGKEGCGWERGEKGWGRDGDWGVDLKLGEDPTPSTFFILVIFSIPYVSFHPLVCFV